MYSAHVKLTGISPMVMGRYYAEDNGLAKKPKELHKDYEERTWRNRLHTNDEGYIIVPGVFLKNALMEVAKYLGEKIPGKGSATYTKHFEAGMDIAEDHYELPIKADDAAKLRIFAPADGARGGSKRVMKNFPRIDKWSVSFTIRIYDETIGQDTLERYLRQCGMFCGLGTFRPRKGGTNGRFMIESIEFEKFEM